MSGLLGKKVRMTQVFDDTGRSIPVTVIAAGPCYVSQVKTEDKDGYQAVQIGYVDLKEKHAKKPNTGHLKKANLKPLKYLLILILINTSSGVLNCYIEPSISHISAYIPADGYSSFISMLVSIR